MILKVRLEHSLGNVTPADLLFAHMYIIQYTLYNSHFIIYLFIVIMWSRVLIYNRPTREREIVIIILFIQSMFNKKTDEISYGH